MSLGFRSVPGADARGLIILISCKSPSSCSCSDSWRRTSPFTGVALTVTFRAGESFDAAPMGVFSLTTGDAGAVGLSSSTCFRIELELELNASEDWHERKNRKQM